jgi:hypothetical protein
VTTPDPGLKSGAGFDPNAVDLRDFHLFTRHPGEGRSPGKIKNPANLHDLSVTTEYESVAMVSGATDVRFGSSVPHG